MRISDWSSDVCSSDLDRGSRHTRQRSRLHILHAEVRLAPCAGFGRQADPRRAYGNSQTDDGLGGEEPRRSSRSCRRSEEHTSELQSLMRTSYAVFCLQKTTNTRTHTETSAIAVA